MLPNIVLNHIIYFIVSGEHKISLVVPAYNEALTISETVERLLKINLPWEKEIIVVDDGSKDGMRDVLRKYEPKIRVIIHEVNKGVGRALETGFKAATGDILVRQDADLEYPPEENINMIKPIIENKADIVYGYRTILISNSHWRKSYQLGGAVINFMAKLFYGFGVKDYLTAAKAARKEVLDKMNLVSRHFEIESEMTAKAVRMGYRLLCVPFSYKPRTFAEGKHIRAKHAIPLMWGLFYWRFAPMPKR